jgi:hypothetical protein
LLAENPILLTKLFDGPLLVLFYPASEGDQQELERIQNFWHS